MNLTVSQLIELLDRAFEEELERLERGGAKACEAENLAVAVTNLQQAAKIKALREKILSLKAEWDSLHAPS